MDDFDLENLIAEIENEPKKPAAGQGNSAGPATQELTLDEIDAFMADLNVGGAAARAQATKKPVIKRANKYTAVGAAHGNELDALLENLDPKNVDLRTLSKGTSLAQLPFNYYLTPFRDPTALKRKRTQILSFNSRSILMPF